ncbi:conserved hypothetical protein [Parafrankia sp. Ea1.12]|uniref:hypothetical protein n=1 Tax=Parafrankia sp. Ea1.12 TaxID=573499 RepID=UPI000DA567F5|nr:hypothetical protein [Parafrankia sp. Ea1.12]SQD96836.1 conserved hypothetical protein [Parafrankia sp. Ea1.12]
MRLHSKETVKHESEKDLVAEVAQFVLRDAAPDELVIFDEVAEEYFRNPKKALSQQQRDEAVGFGLDEILLIPYVLDIVTVVLTSLASFVTDTALGVAEPKFRQFIRRLFRLGSDTSSKTDDADKELSREQIRLIRKTSYDRAIELGLDEDRASILADSIVGKMVATG